MLGGVAWNDEFLVFVYEQFIQVPLRYWPACGGPHIEAGLREYAGGHETSHVNISTTTTHYQMQSIHMIPDLHHRTALSTCARNQTLRQLEFMVLAWFREGGNCHH
jgi:hypothetical protein